MRLAGLLAAVALGAAAASPPPSLRVLRSSPTERAEPTDIVTVAFDRPVAGQLDGTVDARTIFTIEPAVAGKVEWRDPITLRFTPDALLAPGARYTVTIANTFSAMDGSQLEKPYSFSFFVTGPRPISGSPVGPARDAQFLRSETEFEIVFSAPVDLAVASQRVWLLFQGVCAGPQRVGLAALSQRVVADSDPPDYRGPYAWRHNAQAEAMLRVVRFRPEQPLPRGCNGQLVVPQSLDEQVTANVRWHFTTYGPFRVIEVACTNSPVCPAGWAQIRFSTPVKGAEVLRAVRMDPAVAFTVNDTSQEAAIWNLEAALRPRTTYTVTVDPSLRDIFGQPLTGAGTFRLVTTGYQPGIEYPTGRMLVERESFRTLAVRHVNVDSLFVTTAAVPESLEARVLAAPEWNLADAWPLVAFGATTRAIAVNAAADTPLVNAVKLPVYNAARPGSPTLTFVRISRTREDTTTRGRRRRGSGGSGSVALVQVTDLGIVARLGRDEAVAWVTGVKDAQPRVGAAVTLFSRSGQVRARGTTDAQGLVRFRNLAPDTASRRQSYGFQGYVAAAWQSDRAVVSVDDYAWELSPWRFNVMSANDNTRVPVAGAVFTERDIYRPGEMVYAKTIVRTGALGALRAPGPADSVRWTFKDREEGTLRDTTVVASSFGTADQSLALPADALLGWYRVNVQLRHAGAWTDLASATYRVAEYRPPEFLVSVAAADSGARFGGDSLFVTAEARYLFGAPMGRSPVRWTVRRTPMWSWEVQIPGTDDYEIGETGSWWEENESATPGVEVLVTRTDTLDASGHATLRAALGAPHKGRPARVAIEATVTDVNRQSVTSAATAIVHPAAFYLAAKSLGGTWFWRANTPVTIGVLAVRPGGEKVTGVAVRGTIERREWHVVMRRRAGLDERVGEWVADTVAHCDLATAAEPAPCNFTPARGGEYVVSFRARDEANREAATSFYRWASGRDWVPWSDESQFKMDVIPDRTRYDVGDTATILFASPFTGVEAWVTVEREGILEQRRLRIEAGATSIKLALTEAHVPNVFVSIVVARGRSAPAGGIADPGRPTIRVGYAELKVTPRVKRLAVEVRPLAEEYRPGDTARVRLRVRDARGVGRRSEVTLWAVDEGVLALTGYRTPDPVDLIYRPRGLGMHLASDLVSVAAQVLEEENSSIKGDRAPGGGGGFEGGNVLRSRFASTAFFLGSVITDVTGSAVATAKLPDNLTTFRVMAVAVTAGDRYGSGTSSLLVTRPLLARPALPRFLRREDRFTAGVVVNQRAGGTPTVQVSANSRGATLGEAATKSATLEAGRGTEVRFQFRDTTADTAAFRFDVTNGRDSDAVLTKLPVRPSGVPRAHTAAGVVGLTASTSLSLPPDIDAARSRLYFGIGTTPLAIIGGMYRDLAVYPYDCTEQVTDEMLPLIALLKAGTPPAGVRFAPADARRQLEDGVKVIVRRQRPDGSIGIWSADDWSTPWLSAHAGQALLAARAVGVPVRDTVLGRLAEYLRRSFHSSDSLFGPVTMWLRILHVRLAERTAALDFLSRLGKPDVAGEDEMLRLAPQMAWEDRMRLAEILARRGQVEPARQLLAPMWAATRVEGRRAVLPDSAMRTFYFWSDRRPAARLLTATLAVDSANPLVAPLVETLIGRARGARWWWNTQDFAVAVEALSDFTQRQQRAARRGFTVAGGGQVVFRSNGEGDVMREFTRDLTGLLVPAGDSAMTLTLTIAAPSGAQAHALYYYVTVQEVPKVRPVTPDQDGIVVERWYEDYATGRPIISATEGDLVRVRLRIRLPNERQFLALEDPLPAGLEAVDLSLRTVGGLPGPGAQVTTQSRNPEEEGEGAEPDQSQGDYRWGWYYGMWDGGWWSPFDHRDLHDDRVAYFATYLWPGTYSATYVARATTPGVFVRPPAHAEEMYNPSVRGRSDGGEFTVTRRARGQR